MLPRRIVIATHPYGLETGDETANKDFATAGWGGGKIWSRGRLQGELDLLDLARSTNPWRTNRGRWTTDLLPFVAASQ